jgi:hypothetical protein
MAVIGDQNSLEPILVKHRRGQIRSQGLIAEGRPMMDPEFPARSTGPVSRRSACGSALGIPHRRRRSACPNLLPGSIVANGSQEHADADENDKSNKGKQADDQD